MIQQYRDGWRRFWALSWWWKGPILGGTAFITLIVGLAVASGGDGDDTEVLEATREPTPTVTAVTPTTVPSPTTIPTDASSPTPKPTATEGALGEVEEPAPTPKPTQPPPPQPTPTSPPPPQPTPTQPPPPQPTPTSPPSVNCDPSYPTVCIPVGAADYDCAGGSGNGPNYIAGPLTVLPPDPHGLDSDGDGIGCEGY